MCSCDVEACEVYRVVERRARKGHWCSECGSPIFPGERYAYVSGIFDRSPFDERQCASCTLVIAEWRAYVRATPGACDPCFAVGQLWDGIREWLANEADRALEAERRRAYEARNGTFVMRGPPS